MRRALRLLSILGPPTAALCLIAIWAGYPDLLIRDTVDDPGLRRIIFPAIVAFGTTCAILAITTLGSIHEAFKPSIQAGGLALTTVASAFLGAAIGISCEMAVNSLANGIASFAAAGISAGATVGLLLAIVTSKPHPPDPLIEMAESDSKDGN